MDGPLKEFSSLFNDYVCEKCGKIYDIPNIAGTPLTVKVFCYRCVKQTPLFKNHPLLTLKTTLVKQLDTYKNYTRIELTKKEIHTRGLDPAKSNWLYQLLDDRVIQPQVEHLLENFAAEGNVMFNQNIERKNGDLLLVFIDATSRTTRIINDVDQNQKSKKLWSTQEFKEIISKYIKSNDLHVLGEKSGVQETVDFCISPPPQNFIDEGEKMIQAVQELIKLTEKVAVFTEISARVHYILNSNISPDKFGELFMKLLKQKADNDTSFNVTEAYNQYTKSKRKAKSSENENMKTKLERVEERGSNISEMARPPPQPSKIPPQTSSNHPHPQGPSSHPTNGTLNHHGEPESRTRATFDRVEVRGPESSETEQPQPEPQSIPPQTSSNNDHPQGPSVYDTNGTHEHHEEPENQTRTPLGRVEVNGSESSEIEQPPPQPQRIPTQTSSNNSDSHGLSAQNTNETHSHHEDPETEIRTPLGRVEVSVSESSEIEQPPPQPQRILTQTSSNNSDSHGPSTSGAHDHHEEPEYQTRTPLQPALDQPPATPSVIQELMQRVEQLESQYQCQICLDRKCNVVFQCGHLACDQCADHQGLKECHMCRAPISRRQQLFA